MELGEVFGLFISLDLAPVDVNSMMSNLGGKLLEHLGTR